MIEKLINNNQTNLNEEYFKNIWGWDPTILIANNINDSVDIILKYTKFVWTIILTNEVFRYNHVRLKKLLSISLCNLEKKFFHYLFKFGKESTDNTEINIYSNSIILIQRTPFLVKINKSYIKIQWEIIKSVRVRNTEFLILKLKYMISKNLSVQFVQNIDCNTNNSFSNMFRKYLNKNEIYAFIDVTEINSISKIKNIKVISKISNLTKMIIHLKWKSSNLSDLTYNLNRIPCQIMIMLKNVKYI